MNGFGLREQWAAGRSMRHQRLWRDDILLHQLTVNGSLLLIDNTDDLWRALLAPTLAQPADTDWTRLRELLKLLPAGMARRAMYRASLRWWMTLTAWQLATRQTALRRGALDRLADDPAHQALTRRLARAGDLLAQLEWCDNPIDTDEGRIHTADLREAQRQAAAARKPNPLTARTTRGSVTAS